MASAFDIAKTKTEVFGCFEMNGQFPKVRARTLRLDRCSGELGDMPNRIPAAPKKIAVSSK